MSWQNTLAKFFLRHFFKNEKEFDALKTQQKLSLSEPPKNLSARCESFAVNEAEAVWIDRENRFRGVIVYLHGGAFYFGPVKEHWQFIAELCRRTRMAGLVVKYRKAPLFPFPDGFQDVLEVIDKAELNANWQIVGDSCGSGLAIAVCFKLRELGRALPKKLVLLSPWVDLTLGNPEIELKRAEDPMLTVERLSNAARLYVGHADPQNPLISPVFGNLSGLPPMLIQTGTADILYPDCRKFYQKCLAAGIDVKFEQYKNAFHDFMMASFLPETKTALKSQTDFLTDQKT